MLVLSRKLNQEIVIGDNVKITVLKVKGNTVRLGIEAPREVDVMRGELQKYPSSSQPVSETSDQTAEFTVVFSNTDQDHRPNVDVVPFEQPKASDKSSRSRNANASTAKPRHQRNRDESEVTSIQFRDTLPTPLQHNRLKEIVSQLTTKS